MSEETETCRQQIERLNALGRLAGGFANQVNNQMTVVIGFIDLVLRRTDIPPAVEPDLRLARHAAERSVAVTAQLLAFSRRQVLQPELLDLNSVVREFAPTLERAIGARSKLALDLAPRLGTVRADQAQLEQALLYLADNAGEAMPLGGVLSISTEDAWLSEEEGIRRIGIRILAGRYSAVRVSDTGRGIMAPAMMHLFEPFFTTKEEGKGIGLGLATVYGIVKQSDGYIWARSEPGRGATFEIHLPVVEESTGTGRGETGAGALRQSPMMSFG